jgi:hypothetical protein
MPLIYGSDKCCVSVQPGTPSNLVYGDSDRLRELITKLLSIIIDMLKSIALLEYSADILELIEEPRDGINSSDNVTVLARETKNHFSNKKA